MKISKGIFKVINSNSIFLQDQTTCNLYHPETYTSHVVHQESLILGSLQYWYMSYPYIVHKPMYTKDYACDKSMYFVTFCTAIAFDKFQVRSQSRILLHSKGLQYLTLFFLRSIQPHVVGSIVFPFHICNWWYTQ